MKTFVAFDQNETFHQEQGQEETQKNLCPMTTPTLQSTELDKYPKLHHH